MALAYARAGVKRRVALTVSSFGVAASVAATTELVATLPRSLFRALGSRYRLLAAAGPVPKHTVPVFLCWHERARRDPAVSELRALVTATLRA